MSIQLTLNISYNLEAPEDIKTVGLTDRDYSSLITWESTEQQNLVTANVTAVAECYNDGTISEAFLYISGWTTNEVCYIKIYTPQSERHTGVFDTGFRYNGTSNGVPTIWVNVPNVRIEGLQIEDNANFHTFYIDIPSGSGWVEFCYNLVRGRNKWEDKYGYIMDVPADVTLYIWNCMFARNARALVISSLTGKVYIYNCSISGTLRGIYAYLGSNVTVKNVACIGTGEDFFLTGYFAGDSNYNASTDTVTTYAPGDDSMTGVTTSIFTNNTIGAEDFHLVDEASVREQGIDLSNDPYLAFNDDIDGDIRSSGAWDIGADQSPPSPPNSTLSMSYDVEGSVSTNLATPYDIGNFVNSNFAQSYDINIGQNLPIVYSIENLISNNLSLVYDIEAIPNENLSIIYSIASTTSRELPQLYDILVQNSGNIPISYDIVNHVTTNLPQQYDIQLPEPSEEVKTVGLIGRDYSSLITWESTEQQNLVTANAIAVAECYNDGVMSETYLYISGWTTDETRYIKIYTPQSERHTGVFDTGFRYDGTNNGVPTIWVNVPNVRIEGLQIEDNANFHTFYIDIPSGSGWVEFCYNLVRGRNKWEDKYGYILDVPADVTLYIWNCMFARNARALVIASLTGKVYIYNCSVSGTLRGIHAYSGSDVTVKNVACIGTGEDFFLTGYFAGDSDYNASTDTVTTYAPGDNSMTSVTTSIFTNNTVGAEDFHLVGGAQVVGQGVDLSSDPYLTFNDDIDGNVRPPGAWDIGADQDQPVALLPMVYDIQGSGSANLVMLYDIGTFVNSSLAQDYDIGSSADLGMLYDVISFVSNNLELVYDIETPVSQILTTTYDIGVSANLRVLYDVIAFVNNNLGAPYDIGNFVSINFPMAWYNINPQELPMGYDIINFVGTNLPQVYDIGNFVSQNLDISYDIKVSAVLPIQYDIDEHRHLYMSYDIGAPIAENLPQIYDIEATINNDLPQIYNIGVSNQLPIIYDLENFVDNNLDIIYDISTSQVSTFSAETSIALLGRNSHIGTRILTNFGGLRFR